MLEEQLLFLVTVQVELRISQVHPNPLVEPCFRSEEYRSFVLHVCVPQLPTEEVNGFE